MRKALIALACIAVGLLISGVFALSRSEMHTSVPETDDKPASNSILEPASARAEGFEVEVLIDGRPVEEYAARGKRYVEALEGAEYELRIRNPMGARVAVALSVDGLNSIDARRTIAWSASKWVIEPYQTITISGWQMSSARARRFYFTSERNSYGAKLGQTANLGVISAVFFRERDPRPIPVIPPPRPPVRNKSDDVRSERAPNSAGSANESSAAKPNNPQSSPLPDDDYAATGIGRSVRHDVTWVNMELQPRPITEVTIRYEYRAALVRLGILPRDTYPRVDALRRREQSTGFQDRGYSPEP